MADLSVQKCCSATHKYQDRPNLKVQHQITLRNLSKKMFNKVTKHYMLMFIFSHSDDYRLDIYAIVLQVQTFLRGSAPFQGM
jgi:hypothetical protein